jgi:hypothetical protein
LIAAGASAADGRTPDLWGGASGDGSPFRLLGGGDGTNDAPGASFLEDGWLAPGRGFDASGGMADTEPADGLTIRPAVLRTSFRSLFGPSATVLEEDGSLSADFGDLPAGDLEWTELLLVRKPRPKSKPSSGGTGAVRLRAEYLDDFRDLTRIGGLLTVETPWRAGVDTEWHYWREPGDDPGRRGFWTGDFNAIYTFGQGTPVRFLGGLGVNWLRDGRSTQYGLNTTYGLDFHLSQKWVLSGALDWGRVGGDSLWHGRGSLGLMLGRMELYAGYDYFKIGGRSRKGPNAGLGLRF